jgi:hypothetical protein
MRGVDYDQHQIHRAQSNSVQALSQGDARVGWISVRDSRAISAACDRWLESRGVRTRSVWWENRFQFGKKK